MISPDPFCESILQIRELLKESSIWPNRSRLPHEFQSLLCRHVVLHYEVSSDASSGPGPSHHTVDHHDTASVDSARDELTGPVEVSGDVGGWHVIHVESVVVDAVASELGGVDGDVALCGVEDVGDTDALEVVHVLDGFSVGEDDAVVNLVAVDADVSSLVEV